MKQITMIEERTLEELEKEVNSELGFLYEKGYPVESVNISTTFDEGIPERLATITFTVPNEN